MYIDVIAKFYEAEEKAEKKTETEKPKDTKKARLHPGKNGSNLRFDDNASNEEPAPPEVPSELKQREAAVAKKEAALNERDRNYKKKEQEDKKSRTTPIKKIKARSSRSQTTCLG